MGQCPDWSKKEDIFNQKQALRQRDGFNIEMKEEYFLAGDPSPIILTREIKYHIT